mgnify:CR=1 FL=1
MRYTIGQLAEIIDGDRGKNYPKQDEFYPQGYCLFLNTGNVTKEGLTFKENQFITKEKDEALRKGKLKRGDIVYTTRGTVGNAGYYNSNVPYENVRINSGMVILRANGEIVDARFLYQILKSEYYRPYFKQYCTGSAQPQLPIKNFSQIYLNVPDIKTQHRIADILSAYDELIENNQKQIKLLEEAAQRLYKEWFVDLRFPGHENTKIVDGVPEGWIKEEIGKIIKKVHRTKQIVASEYKDEGSIPIVDQSRAFVAGYTNDLEARVDFGIPIIVFGDHTRIVKLIQFPFAKGADGTQLIISDCLEMPQRLLYCSIMNVDLSNYHYARHFKYLKEEKIMIPTVKVANGFENNVTGIFSKIQNCRDEIIRCQKTSDLLLPKLMSGEVEV